MQADLPEGRLAGAFLIASAVVTTVALTHHPAVSARRPSGIVGSLVAAGPFNAAFHAFMIVMIVVLLLGLIGLSRRRGLQSMLVTCGLVAASLGLAAEIGAALTDGFFFPAFGVHLAGGNPASIGQGLQVLAAAWIVLQVLAKFGLAATTAAIALWSIELFDRDRAHVALAVVGFAGAAGTIILLSTAATSLTSHNVAFVFGIQACWYAFAGVLMVQRRL